MKRAIALILTINLILVCCTACGKTADEVLKKEYTRAEKVEYDGTLLTVAFLQTGSGSAWDSVNTDNFKATFSETKGYNFIYIDCKSDAKRQMRYFRDLIAQEVPYIIVDPVVATGWETALADAKEKNITVIFSDREVDADPSLYKFWVGSDSEEEGRDACRHLASYFEAQGESDKEVKIAIIEGTEGSSKTIARTKGIESEARENHWNIVAKAYGKYNQGDGREAMQNILKTTTDFNVLIAENDDMMIGAMKALDEVGITYGVDGKVATASFDSTRSAFNMMLNKQLIVSVECNPFTALTIENTMVALQRKESIDSKQYMPESVYMYDDAKLYVADRRY